MTDSLSKTDARRREATYRILRNMEAKKIGLRQAQAQLRDLGYAQWEIDLYIEGDTGESEDA